MLLGRGGCKRLSEDPKFESWSESWVWGIADINTLERLFTLGIKTSLFQFLIWIIHFELIFLTKIKYNSRITKHTC